MKPFDLEAAKRGEPIQTVSGMPMKFIIYIPDAKECNQLVVMNLEGTLCAYNKNGEASYGREHLRMVTKKRTVWVNLYPSVQLRNAAWHPTEAEADSAAGTHRLSGKAWPLEIEE